MAFRIPFAFPFSCPWVLVPFTVAGVGSLFAKFVGWGCVLFLIASSSVESPSSGDRSISSSDVVFDAAAGGVAFFVFEGISSPVVGVGGDLVGLGRVRVSPMRRGVLFERSSLFIEDRATVPSR